MWVSIGIHIPQQSLVRTYPSNEQYPGMTAVLFTFRQCMAISTCTFLGSGLTPDHDITSQVNGMLVHQNRHLSLLSFRLAFLHILRTLSRVTSWLLPMSSNLQWECPQCQIHLALPGTAHLFFSKTYVQPVPHQMAVTCIYIYQKDKGKLLSMMNAHLDLSCGTLSLH